VTLLHERRAHYVSRPAVVVANEPDIREARAKARQLVLAADQDQLDDIREYDETRESCRDRMFRLLDTSPELVQALFGG
jgi:hypothetical protein